MKKILFLFSMSLVLAACSNSQADLNDQTSKSPTAAEVEVKVDKATNSPTPTQAANKTNPTSPAPATTEVENTSSQSIAMEDLPCHKMPNGSLMGDCPVDEFGHPYVPAESGSDNHDDPNTEAHLHQDDHAHAEGTEPHEHNDAPDHDDTGQPPHRH